MVGSKAMVSGHVLVDMCYSAELIFNNYNTLVVSVVSMQVLVTPEHITSGQHCAYFCIFNSIKYEQ